MPLGSTFEADLLNLFLCAKAIANIADNASAGPYTATWSALHTADPSSGTQATSELSLTGYTRIATTRSTVGYTVTGSGPATASPVSAITFPQLTSTSTATITHWSVGGSSSGAGKIFACGTVSPNISGAQNVTPQITTASSITLS